MKKRNRKNQKCHGSGTGSEYGRSTVFFCTGSQHK